MTGLNESSPIHDALVLERFVAWLDQVHVAADVVGAS